MIKERTRKQDEKAAGGPEEKEMRNESRESGSNEGRGLGEW